MEEGEEEEDEEEKEEDEESAQSNIDVCRTSSNTFLMSDPQDVSEGLVNPAFSPDDSESSSRSRYSSQWRGPGKSTRGRDLPYDLPYGYCRSLSSSMENITFSGAPLSPTRGSFPSLDEGRSSFGDNRSLQGSRSQGIVVVGNARTRKKIFITSSWFRTKECFSSEIAMISIYCMQILTSFL